MTLTDIHCPACGHHLFKADLGELSTRKHDTSTPAVESAAAAIAAFLAGQARIVRSGYGRALQGDVIESLNGWLERNGQPALSNKAVGRGMLALGFETSKSQGKRYYRGLAALPPSE